MSNTINGDENQHKKYYFVPDEQLAPKPFYDFIKRLCDIVLSVLAVILCALPMVVIAVLIKCDSEGPVIYRQERLGKNGKPFMLLKFRSMVNSAEDEGAKWADENDPRCTKIGLFLRRSRLDELPQFFNIIAGSMSIVGPRPERPFFYNEFEKRIHGFSNRLKVLPGLTGLAQVSGGYDLKPEEKIVYDMEYIRTRSVAVDTACIIKTVAVIFNHKGAR